ncbi:MAG: hypothetical protein PHV79_03370, partial [Clostridia bacterium]|nr:hypothetical protein [Clostridia bacterium]
MNKKLAKRNFISIAIIAIILITLCFANFPIPGTTQRFIGFANAITTDIDLSGGFAAQYEIKFPDQIVDKDQKVKDTSAFIKNKLIEYGYKSASVSVAGMIGNTTANQFYIEIPNFMYAKEVLKAVVADGSLYIRTTETTEVGENDLSGDDISNAFSTFTQLTASEYKWGTTIELSKEGATKIKKLTEDGSGTIYIYIGDEIFSNISFKEQITDNSFYVHGSSPNKETANIYAFTLLMAKQEISFELIGDQVSTISPLLGENTLLFSLIAVLLIIALFIFVMILIFGDFGYLAGLSLAIYFALIMFFMQAIPIFVLSISGIIGALIGLLLLFSSFYIIFDNIKSGYAEGKKIPLST